MHKKIYSLGAEQGAVLLTTLVMLVLLTLLGLTTMRTTTMEERMSANSQRTQQIFQSIDSAVIQAARDPDLYVDKVTTDTVNIGGFLVNTSTRFRESSATTGRSGILAQQYQTSFVRFFFEIDASIAPQGGSGRTGAAAVQAGMVRIVPGSQ